jgi:hypothetical protein
MKVLALTMSSVLTPKIFFGLYLPAFLKISAAMGTVLFTGFEMMAMIASGQTSAAAYPEKRTSYLQKHLELRMYYFFEV